MNALLQFNQYAIEPSWIECYQCGVAFAISPNFRSRLVNNHNIFFCPNGHEQHFVGETEAQRIKREMQEQLNQANTKIEWLRSQVATAERNERATRTKLTKLKNRVEAGICPYCHRTFKQLQQHMACKHSAEIEHADMKVG